MAHSNTGGHLYYLKSREGQKKKKDFHAITTTILNYTCLRLWTREKEDKKKIKIKTLEW